MTASKRKRTAYLFVGPFLALFTVFFLFPLGYELRLSLFRNVMGVNSFAGLSNYRLAFHDAAFWHGMARVGLFGLLQLITVQGLGLVFALLLDGPWIKAKSVFRLIYLLPYAVPGVIAALMWGFLLAPGLDPMLKLLGSVTGGVAPNLLASGFLLYVIVAIVTWEWAGYNMTLYYAGLTALPLEIYEAARLDGCTEFQLALRIKVPMLQTMVGLTVLLSIIGALQLFTEPYILSGITPVSPTYTPNLYAYNMGFNYGNFNYAATLSFILAMITLAATGGFLWLRSQRGRFRAS